MTEVSVAMSKWEYTESANGTTTSLASKRNRGNNHALMNAIPSADNVNPVGDGHSMIQPMINPMIHPLMRTLALPIGIALSAGAFALVIPLWTSARGVVGPTLADSETPVFAAIATMAAFAFATVVAIGVSRIVNACVGTFVLGCGVGMLALRSGNAADFAFGSSRLVPAAIETLVWALLIAGASYLIFTFGGRLADIPLQDDSEIDSTTGPMARRAWFAAVAGVVVAWFCAASDSKGQAIAAATIGSFVVGFGARWIARQTQPMFVAAAAALAFALVAMYIAFAARGELASGFVDGSFPRLLRLMPVDIAAGALAGSAMGFGFARSFVTPSAPDA